MRDDEGFALFLEDVAVALRRWAARMREGVAAAGAAATPRRAGPASMVERVRGKNQRAILALPGMAAEEGMRTAELAEASDIKDVPNAWNTVQALVRSGYVELVPDSNPQRWRLRAPYRQVG